MKEALKHATMADLQREIRRRERLRLQGLCDFCERPHTDQPCEHRIRHNTTSEPVSKAKQVAEALRKHPGMLVALVRELGLPVPKCEGHQGPCGQPVLYLTDSRTMYEWDGEGDDPNAPLALCPACSLSYTEEMADRWAEYRSAVL